MIQPADAADAAGPAWTGLHAGIGGGYGAALQENANDADDGASFVGEAGFDFQLAERVILGVAGDYTWAHSEPESTWTLAGRSGFLSSPQTLWYGLAGWSRADIPEFEAVELDGFTVGLGVESRLTDALSLKLEYRHSDFSAEGAGLETNFETTVHTVRGVLSWRFNLLAEGNSRPKVEPLSGCAKALRAPGQYSRATVKVCEIATSL